MQSYMNLCLIDGECRLVRSASTMMAKSPVEHSRSLHWRVRHKIVLASSPVNAMAFVCHFAWAWWACDGDVAWKLRGLASSPVYCMLALSPQGHTGRDVAEMLGCLCRLKQNTNMQLAMSPTFMFSDVAWTKAQTCWRRRQNVGLAASSPGNKHTHTHMLALPPNF